MEYLDKKQSAYTQNEQLMKIYIAMANFLKCLLYGVLKDKLKLNI